LDQAKKWKEKGKRKKEKPWSILEFGIINNPKNFSMRSFNQE
jgi:hypothetical protein